MDHVVGEPGEGPLLRQVVGEAPRLARGWGLLAVTEAMAVEFAPLGVRCNAVGPGTVLTEGTAGHYGNDAAQSAIAGCLPVGRMGQPMDIANAVAFLVSDEAAWITGQVLFVDGGYTASTGQFFRWARKAPK